MRPPASSLPPGLPPQASLFLAGRFRRRFNTLPSAYWQGISRPSRADQLAYTLDGSPVPDIASNEPYAHWTWTTPAKLGQDLNCAMATLSTAYDVYLGTEDGPSQASQKQYVTAASNAERKYGWDLEPCRQALPYICEAPPEAFACPSPPLPPPSPPSPPPPPSPPAPPTCELLALNEDHWSAACAW